MVDEDLFQRFADQVASAVKAEMAVQFERFAGELAGVRLEREHGDHTLAQRDSIHDERIEDLRVEHGKVTYALTEIQRELNAGLTSLREVFVEEIRGVEARLEKQLDEQAADMGTRVGNLEAERLPERMKKLERHSDDVVRGWTDANGRTIPQRMGTVETQLENTQTEKRTLGRITAWLIAIVALVLGGLLTAWAIAAWGPPPTIGG